MHFVVTQFLTIWRSSITPVKNSTSQSHQKNNQKAYKLVCDVLLELTPNFEFLSDIGRERFLENLENALRMNRLKFEEIHSKIPETLLTYPGFKEGFSSFYDKHGEKIQ